MSDNNIVLRIERFERTVATCLSMVPALFAAQCFFVSLGAPAFANMFKDFGAKLPPLTEFVLNTWGFWMAFAIVVPISTIVISRKKSALFSVIFSTVAGVVMFAVSQTLTAALFLPIWQLGAVAGGLK